MYLERLREEVFQAEESIKQTGLVNHMWGCVSGFDKESSLVVIKPAKWSKEIGPSDMVITNLDGEVVEGSMTPCADVMTHIEMYKTFPDIGGIVYAQSLWATAWAQAGRSIQAIGTAHADRFFGEIPCTRSLRPEETESDYEKNCGLIVAERMRHRVPGEINAVLLNKHGPFTWGKSPMDALSCAEYLEEIAHLAWLTYAIKPGTAVMPYYLMTKRFGRKHGA